MKTKSTFSVLYVIQKGQDKLRPNGNAPIIGRITVNGEKAHFATQLDIPPDRWAVGEGKTLGKTYKEQCINSSLDDFRSLAKTYYNALLVGGKAASPAKIKEMMFGKKDKKKKYVIPEERPEEKKIMLLEHFDKFNEDYRLMVGKGTTQKTYTRYVLTRNRLAEFMKRKYQKEGVPIAAVNYTFINDFFIF